MEANRETTPQIGVDPATLIVLLGKVVSFADLYGPDHKMSRSAIGAAYGEFSKVLAGEKNSIVINVADNALLVDGSTVESKNPLVARFAERLKGLNIYGFSLKEGMAEDEFSRLVGLLCVRESVPGVKPFTEAISDGTFQHVAPSRTVLREVEEDEEVVKKMTPAEEEEASVAYSDDDVREIVAFLRGDIGVGDRGALQDPDAVADNVQKLSELIMQSVAVRQRQGSLDAGESMADLVVGCLRRTYEGLSNGQAARTKTGRKRIDRAMVVLEKEVLERLRTFAGDAVDGVTEQVAKEVQAIRDEINMDNLISDYLRRRKAVEDSQKKLVKLMQSKDPEWIAEVGLQESLLEGGLDVSDWRQLALASGAGTGTGGAAGGGAATQAGQAGVNMLALVLNELTELMEKTSPDRRSESEQQQVDQALNTIGREVNATIERTEQKIDELAAGMDPGELGPPSVPSTARPRSQHDWALVAEIVQEICQPLTVINCTIDMLGNDRFGEVPEAGRQPLNMVQECTARMHDLAERLVEVCGVPVSLVPEPLAEND